ncbi:transglutaminase family protein [Tropicimonas sp.]|uniref:transglutaminase family protein n=1 Tax=Tropicimonas sp. TaxID=2067044 RepID=UPI003A85A357
MLYDIRMEIAYTYQSPAGSGRQLLRLMPADLPDLQRLIAGSLTIEPEPSERLFRQDFFGNQTVEVALAGPLHASRFAVSARVERQVAGRLLDMSPDLDGLARDLAGLATLSLDSPHHFLGNSPRIVLHPEMSAYARRATSGAGTVCEAVRRLGQAIHADFTFDAEATDVDTPAIAAFERRKGVCQDFTHIMISCLRGIGIPAGYVSGFLRTVPPVGQPRLEGADAMHAWVRAWCGPEMGWIEYDPTNALEIGGDHVVIARGRDYSDVAPVRGVLRLSGEQRTGQKVDVIPIG